MDRRKNRIAAKVVSLDLDHDLGLKQKELNKIVAVLDKRKAAYASDDEWLSAIESMMENIRTNPHQEEIKQKALAVSKLCPVCGQASEPITLMKGRKAYYCKQHRAVSPAMINEEQ